MHFSAKKMFLESTHYFEVFFNFFFLAPAPARANERKRRRDEFACAMVWRVFSNIFRVCILFVPLPLSIIWFWLWLGGIIRLKIEIRARLKLPIF